MSDNHLNDSSSALFGHERRRAKRESERKQATIQGRDICQAFWQEFMDEIEGKNSDNTVISDERITQLYDDIFSTIKSQINTRYHPFALFERKRFFESVNRNRLKQGLEALPLPVIAARTQRPKNINEFEQFLYLSHAQNVVTAAIKIWQQKNKFSLTDCISWFLFSLISFGGYNDTQVIIAVYKYLKDAKPIYQIFNDILCIPLRLRSDDYANEIVNEQDNDQVFYRSRLIIIDDVSRLWLLHLQRQLAQNELFPELHQVMRRLGEFTQDGFTIKSIAKSAYLKNISIYWQTLPSIKLDIQLVEVLTGNQKHTALSPEHWLRYFQTIKVPKVALTDEHFSQLIIECNSQYSDDGSDNIQVKSDIVKNIRNILNNDKQSIKSALEKLSNQSLYPNQQRLVTWMIELYMNGNKTSTLRRYLSEVGNAFIAGTRGADFVGWTKHEYHYIYEDILSEKTDHKKGYTTTVLCSLHDSLKRHYQAPSIDLRGGGDPQIVASYLIPSQLYSSLQTSIAEQNQLSNYYKQLLQVVLALLYRTGMRISEILGLQVQDIEYDNQGFLEYNIIVRSNAHRSLKSDDGTRRISLSTLLPDKELKHFIDFFNAKKDQSSRYLFTLAYKVQPLSRHSIEQPIKAILADTPYHDITLHSFRHNAISNMAVILRCQPHFATYFTDYSEEDISRIKYHLLGEARGVSSNYWDALMEFAGHADLNTTFSSYIHTADIIASHQMNQAKLTLPLEIVNKLVNTSRVSLHQHNNQAYDAKKNVVHLSAIRSFINKKISKNNLIGSKPESASSQSFNQADRNDGSQPSAIFGRYSRRMIEKMLQDIEEGQNLSEASHLNFVYSDVLIIYDQAVRLVQDADGKLNHKLISKNRRQKSNHVLIAPTSLHYHEEKALANLCFDNLERLYQFKESRRTIKQMLDVFYKKVNTSKSEIRFTFKEQKLFYHYLTVMCQILPSKHWRVNISALQYQSYVDDKGKRIIESLVDKKGKLKRVEAFHKAHPNFTSEVTTADGYNGYALSVISPINNRRGSNKGDNKASVLMKYILHLLLIVKGLSD